MEKEDREDMYLICLDKIEFIMSKRDSMEQTNKKKPDFMTICHKTFFSNLSTAIQSMENESTRIKMKQTYELLEELNFSLSKLIQFIVVEGLLDRIKPNKIRPRNLGIELFYYEIENKFIDLLALHPENEGILFTVNMQTELKARFESIIYIFVCIYIYIYL